MQGEKRFQSIKCRPHASCWLFFFLLLISSCSTKTVSVYQPPSPSEHKFLEQTENVSVAIRPMLNNGEQIQYFGTSLTNRGVLPISIVVENRSTSDSYLLTGDQIQVSKTAKGINPDQVVSVEDATAVGVAGGVLISPVLILAGGKMYSDATVTKHSISKNELRRTIVSPGKIKHGFVYASIEKNQKNIFIMVPLRDTVKQSDIYFQFSIDLTQ